jgi:hypothetical protein
MRARFAGRRLTPTVLMTRPEKEAARLSHGLTDVREVRQATLQRDGKISIVPWLGKRE